MKNSLQKKVIRFFVTVITLSDMIILDKIFGSKYV